MEDSILKKYTVDCNCHNADHMVKFEYYKDRDGETEIYIQPLLNYNYSFWARVVNAFCYVFKIDRKSYYYHFDSVHMDIEEFSKLKEWMNSL